MERTGKTTAGGNCPKFGFELIMKNKLQIFIEKNGLDEIKTLNLLQNNGIISDNCVTAADVADVNFPAVEEFLSDDGECKCGACANCCEK